MKGFSAQRLPGESLQETSLGLISLFAGFLVLFSAGPATADVVELRDGSRIKGTVLSMNANVVELETPNGLFKLDRKNVVGIRYDDREKEAADAVRRAIAEDREGEEPVEQEEERSIRPAPVRFAAGDPTEFERSLLLRGGIKGGNDEVDSGPWFEANFLFDVEQNFYIGPGIGYWKADNKVETLSKGDITAIPIFLRMRLEAGATSVRPYLELAFGYFFLDHDLDPELQDGLASVGLSLEEDVQDDTGAILGAGVDFALSETAALGLHVGYVSLKPEVEGTLRDSFGDSISFQDDVKLNSIYGGVSLTGRF